MRIFATLTSRSFRLVLLAAAFLLLAQTASAITVEWVTVGGAGNACDTQTEGCFGAVADTYRISKTEVTNAQYAEFLNAVSATDTNALYNSSMGSGFGGITRSGSSGSYTYSAIVGREDMPANFVSFYDSLRFANWLHNGQPTGAQGITTTEDGAYTMITESYPSTVITRNAGASVFLPSEDEWYKAAYYDTGSTSYFDYPAGSDTRVNCALPVATANTANCAGAVGDLTDIGSYTGAASPNGTFDQGGNLFEWNEAIPTLVSLKERGMRGGTFIPQLIGFPVTTGAAFQWGGDPSGEAEIYGFRVASLVPPPSVPSLTPLGMALLGSLLGIAGLRGVRKN